MYIVYTALHFEHSTGDYVYTAGADYVRRYMARGIGGLLGSGIIYTPQAGDYV